MNNKEPEKKDVWEEDLWYNVMEDYVITAELGHVAKNEKAHKDEMRQHFARLTEYIRQNFIPRAEVVEKVNKIAYLSDDLGGGKAVSLDDLLDLLTQEK